MSFINIVIYKTSAGKVPFIDWLEDLDKTTRSIVKTRLDRLRLGNFGDTKSIKNGEGIRELRIDHGPGYRIYYAMQGTKIVILLVGGDKRSQTRDITKAKHYWLEYEE